MQLCAALSRNTLRQFRCSGRACSWSKALIKRPRWMLNSGIASMYCGHSVENAIVRGAEPQYIEAIPLFRARVLLVEGADEAAALDAEQRNCLNVLRLSAAHNCILHAVAAGDDQVGASKEKPARAHRGHDLHIGGRLANVVGVVVFEILPRADAFRPARWVRARRKPGEEIRA